MIEVIISILHATPYAKIGLWIVRRRRFPSGIWFEIVSGETANVLGFGKMGFFSKQSLQPRKAAAKDGGSRILVSILRSNVSNLGKSHEQPSSFLPSYSVWKGENGRLVLLALLGCILILVLKVIFLSSLS